MSFSILKVKETTKKRRAETHTKKEREMRSMRKRERLKEEEEEEKEKEIHVIDLVSPITEICKNKILKHRSCWLHIVAIKHGNQKTITKQDLDDVRDKFEQIAPCFLETLHTGVRSKTRHGFKNNANIKKKKKLDTTYPKEKGKLDTGKFQEHLDKLWRTFPEDKKTSCAYLDCFWYPMYLKEQTKAKVLTWIKKRHIFSKKYVFVPIVCWGHWSLLIFCHFGESTESKEKTPCMLLLDSLEKAGPRRLEPDIRKFVLDIYIAEGRSANKKSISTIPLLVPKVPQQRDDMECGIFVLYYLNLFMECAPENFSIHEGYPYFMVHNWFSGEGVESFCLNLDSRRK